MLALTAGRLSRPDSLPVDVYGFSFKIEVFLVDTTFRTSA